MDRGNRCTCIDGRREGERDGVCMCVCHLCFLCRVQAVEGGREGGNRSVWMEGGCVCVCVCVCVHTHIQVYACTSVPSCNSFHHICMSSCVYMIRCKERAIHGVCGCVEIYWQLLSEYLGMYIHTCIATFIPLLVLPFSVSLPS